MITNIPLSELENKDEKVYYIKFRNIKYLKCILGLFIFLFICTLIGYFVTGKHDVAWLYINFLFGLAILILIFPHVMSIYVTCNEKKNMQSYNEEII